MAEQYMISISVGTKAFNVPMAMPPIEALTAQACASIGGFEHPGLAEAHGHDLLENAYGIAKQLAEAYAAELHQQLAMALYQKGLADIIEMEADKGC